MKVCADTGFIAKLYLNEGNSQQAVALLTRLAPPLHITKWHVLEFTNAIQRAVFSRAIDADQASKILAAFQTDLAAGVFSHVSVDHDAALERARQLTYRHTPNIGTRTLDLVHVACAIEMGATHFVSFDDRQVRAARLEGLQVLP